MVVEPLNASLSNSLIEGSDVSREQRRDLDMNALQSVQLLETSSCMFSAKEYDYLRENERIQEQAFLWI